MMGYRYEVDKTELFNSLEKKTSLESTLKEIEKKGKIISNTFI